MVLCRHGRESLINYFVQSTTLIFSSPFDAPAMYARDIKKLEKWIGAWISTDIETYQLPFSIIYPTDFLPVSNKAQMELIDDFVADLETTHGVSRTKVSLKDLWKEKTPSGADSTDIAQYLKDVGEVVILLAKKLTLPRWVLNRFVTACTESSTNFEMSITRSTRKSPTSTRSCAGDGLTQFDLTMGRMLIHCREAAKNVTQDQHNDAANRLRVYKDWLLKEVLQVGKRDSVIVLPITSQAVDYRDVPPPEYAPLSSRLYLRF